MVMNPVTQPVSDLVVRRHSPRAFDGRPVDDAALRALFEAARWAPSSYNEQPWRFVVVRRGDPEHDAAVALLSEGNQRWAPEAPVLVFALAADTFRRSGQPNPHAAHDVGQALAWLTVEATERGLAVRQMAGFSREGARALFGVPEGYSPITALALGWPADVSSPGVRQRRALDEVVFRRRFGSPA